MDPKPLQRLAQGWLELAEQDGAASRCHLGAEVELLAFSRTRKNCAWELLRTLARMEKENPPGQKADFPPTAADSESA